MEHVEVIIIVVVVIFRVVHKVRQRKCARGAGRHHAGAEKATHDRVEQEMGMRSASGRRQALQKPFESRARQDIAVLVTLLDGLGVDGSTRSTTAPAASLRMNATDLGEALLAERARILALGPFGNAPKAKAVIASTDR